MEHARKFDEQNFDELIVAIARLHIELISRKSFDKLLAICQSFPSSNFCYSVLFLRDEIMAMHLLSNVAS